MSGTKAIYCCPCTAAFRDICSEQSGVGVAAGISVEVGTGVAEGVRGFVEVGIGASEAAGDSVGVVSTPHEESSSPIDIASPSLMRSRRDNGLEVGFNSDIVLSSSLCTFSMQPSY